MSKIKTISRTALTSSLLLIALFLTAEPLRAATIFGTGDSNEPATTLELNDGVFLEPTPSANELYTSGALKSGPNKLVVLLMKITAILNAFIPILIGLSVLFFLWGILKYVFAKGEVAQSEAKGVIVYGIIALTVMVSIWGLVNILAMTFDFELGGGLQETSIHTFNLYGNFLDGI